MSLLFIIYDSVLRLAINILLYNYHFCRNTYWIIRFFEELYIIFVIIEHSLFQFIFSRFVLTSVLNNESVKIYFVWKLSYYAIKARLYTVKLLIALPSTKMSTIRHVCIYNMMILYPEQTHNLSVRNTKYTNCLKTFTYDLYGETVEIFPRNLFYIFAL